MRYLPNIITCVRIAGTIGLLFIEPMSLAFYIVYTVSGLSDMLDGFVARKLNVSSAFGARLDSVADLLFYTVMLIRIFPVLWAILPYGIWIGVGIVLVIRIMAYITATVKYRQFAAQHTYMNKITGGSVFLVPYIIKTPMYVGLCTLVVIIAGLASLEEWVMHIKMRAYDGTVKTIFSKKIHN